MRENDLEKTSLMWYNAIMGQAAKEASMTKDHYMELQIMISVAEAGWKGSPCWHVFDYICYKLHCRYPLVARRDCIINPNANIA